MYIYTSNLRGYPYYILFFLIKLTLMVQPFFTPASHHLQTPCQQVMILVVVIALDGGFVSYEAPVDTKTNIVRTHKCFRTHMNVSGMGNSNIVQAKYKQNI